MHTDDFRHIEARPRGGRAERLFRAAVSAFCALSHPGRQDAAQVDDLVLPLYDAVPADTRRFAAAALSEVRIAPPGLLNRLSAEPLAISAPLLLRSPALASVDLVALAGRHGIDHARLLARRAGLTESEMRRIAAAGESSGRDATPPAAPVDETREALRAMMLPASETTGAPAPAPAAPDLEGQPRGEVFPRLLSAALTGVPVFFQTALADALRIGFRQARDLFGGATYYELLPALRALGLEPEQAFTIAAAIYPAQFPHAEAIRLFMERFSLLHPDKAAERVRAWRGETLADAFHSARAGANDEAGSAPPHRTLRAG